MREKMYLADSFTDQARERERKGRWKRGEAGGGRGG